MDRHGRPLLQRAPASTDQMTRSSIGARPRPSRHMVDEEAPNVGHRSRETRRRRDTSTSAGSPEGLPYACPYAKHDPITYSHSRRNVGEDHEYRNCSTGYWTTIARLKQHLYRTHAIFPARCCQRCWQNFPDEAKLRDHTTKRSCKPCPMPEEKMDEDQQKRIAVREQGKPVESWLKIYKILFPNDEEPLSVHAEWVTGQDLRTCFEILTYGLPRLLFKAAQEDEPRARGIQYDNSLKFPVTGEDIETALLRCQREFGQRTGLGHVFASGPPSREGSTARGERSTTLASRTRPNLEQQPHRNARNVSVDTSRSYYVEHDEAVDDSSSSSSSTTEMSIDDEMSQDRRHGYASSSRAHINYPITTGMPYTPSPYAAVTAAPTAEDLLQAQLIQNELFAPDSIEDYQWS